MKKSVANPLELGVKHAIRVQAKRTAKSALGTNTLLSSLAVSAICYFLRKKQN